MLQPRPFLQELTRRLVNIAAAPPGLDRHATLAEAFLDLGMLVQGLADAEFEKAGFDDDTPLQADASRALHSLAHLLVVSWRAEFRGPLKLDHAPLTQLCAYDLPQEVRCKTPEGYAYYAVYPEAYAQAAEHIGDAGSVIGLRSIGVTLAAVVAAALDTPAPITLRPVGHPYQRELHLSPTLEAKLLRVAGSVVIADEGPGRSGSSFGAIGDWFEDRGVGADRLAILPSHRGEPGPMASDRHLARWAKVRRPVCEFDDLAIDPSRGRHRLEAWVEDLTGPALRPLQDISGGRWRENLPEPDRPPAYTGQERRKFLLTSSSGLWLLKFAGLGAAGRETFERARRLGDAGLTPRPRGYRYGFIVEPWVDGRPVDDRLPRPFLIEAISRYLAFRAAAFPAEPHQGAGEAELKAMVEANVGEALGSSLSRTLTGRFPTSRLDLRPMRIDGRLHRWEWLLTPDGRLMKTDAVDHDNAHDLIGCQDLAWDVAGAEAEFNLSPPETQALTGRLGRAGCTVQPDVLAFMRAAYAAFQLGLWTQALACADEHDSIPIAQLIDGYGRRLDKLAQ